MTEYEQAVRNLKSYCNVISNDYNPKSWFGKFFVAIQTIQEQMDDGIPNVQLIISSAELIKNYTSEGKFGDRFRAMFGKIPNQEGNILDVIDIIEAHYRAIFDSMKGPKKQDFEMRPMTSLLLQLRQCA